MKTIEGRGERGMEAEIADWGRRFYPRLIENPVLIESLYRKKVLNQVTSQQTMAYPLGKIASLEPNKVVALIVTKVDSTVRTHQVCSVCHRKACTDSTHPPERIPFYAVSMTAGDESGMDKFHRVGTDKADVDLIEQNEDFVIHAMLKTPGQYGREVAIKRIVPLSKANVEAWGRVDDYWAVHGGEMGVAEDEFSKVTAGLEKELTPFMEMVFIAHVGGRVKF